MAFAYPHCERGAIADHEHHARPGILAAQPHRTRLGEQHEA
jgi:hypothetical protein